MNVKLKFKTEYLAKVMTSVVPRAHNRDPFWLHLSHPISELYSILVPDEVWKVVIWGEGGWAANVCEYCGWGLLPGPRAQEQGWRVTLCRRRGPFLWQHFLSQARKCLFTH